MTKTSPVYARVNSAVKSQAENILSKLGMSPSSAIEMYYDQIIYNNGLPFSVTLPKKEKQPTAIDGMTTEELRAEILKGINSLQHKPVHTSEEVDKEFKGKL